MKLIDQIKIMFDIIITFTDSIKVHDEKYITLKFLKEERFITISSGKDFHHFIYSETKPYSILFGKKRIDVLGHTPWSAYVLSNKEKNNVIKEIYLDMFEFLLNYNLWNIRLNKYEKE